MSHYPRPAAYLFEDCVEHGLVVVEGDGADERPAELVYVAQGHGGEVHFLEGRPAITFRDKGILQRWTKKWTWFAKREPGNARQKFLAT